MSAWTGPYPVGGLAQPDPGRADAWTIANDRSGQLMRRARRVNAAVDV
jgi:hypothetical protein